jgi:hypothetical protein
MKISDDRERRRALLKKLNGLLFDIERDRKRIAEAKSALGTALAVGRDRLSAYASTRAVLAKSIPTFDELPSFDELVAGIKPIGLAEQLDDDAADGLDR